MSKFRSALLVAAVAALTAGCGTEAAPATSFPATALLSATSTSGERTVSVKTSPSQPPGRGVSAVEYTVTDAQGAPVDELALGVVPWMPAMGHGTSVTPTVENQGGGVYVVTNVYFYMAGQWNLRTHISESGTSDDVTPSFEIP